MSGDLRFGVGTWHFYRGGISCRRIDVSGGLPVDRLWYRMLEKEVRQVKIIVWKAPRMLRGILRHTFGIKE